MSNALKNYNSKVTPQTEKSREDEVKNNAGGYVFAISNASRLERFLILGTDGGTYYASEKDITKQNVDFIIDLIRKDETLVRETTVAISDAGRAYKNSPALFVMALLFTQGNDKAASRVALQKVARTSTHLFEFSQYIENLGGWGRAKRNAVADWYTSKTDDQLAYQLVKYRQRDGWTHRDLLRLSHPEGLSETIASFALGKGVGADAPIILQGFNKAQAADTPEKAVKVLNEYTNLPWETLPTNVLTNAKVWQTLFDNGQLKGQALIRNITRLAKLGSFNDAEFAKAVAAKLTDADEIAKTRLHPVNYLNALLAYSNGVLPRNSGWYSRRERAWDTKAKIVDALEDGFYASFGYVEPAGKSTLLALDISGSMTAQALGLSMTCSEISAAVAMTVARTEPDYEIRGFCTTFKDLGITAKTDLKTALKTVKDQTMGGTDCSLPMEWAIKKKLDTETFVVLTDSETYAGRRHPHQALKDYRAKSGKDARLAVLGVASNKFTIADPSDPGMMDFVGFDSSAPKVLADFSAGRL